MTTTTITATRPVASPPARIWRVARLNVANPITVLILPWVFLAAILLMNIAIWAIITYAADPGGLGQDPFKWGGALAFVFIYLGIAAIQMMAVTFPFALGYGVTRRDFYLGSSLTFVLLAFGYATGLTILGGVERLTGGWGLNGRMFTAVYFAGNEPWYVQFWVFLCGLLFAMFLGSVFASVWVRWKAIGITTAFLGLGVVLIGVLALLTYAQLWAQFWAAIVDLGFVGVASASLVVTVLVALLGFFILRGATPKP